MDYLNSFYLYFFNSIDNLKINNHISYNKIKHDKITLLKKNLQPNIAFES